MDGFKARFKYSFPWEAMCAIGVNDFILSALRKQSKRHEAELVKARVEALEEILVTCHCDCIMGDLPCSGMTDCSLTDWIQSKIKHLKSLSSDKK